VEPATDYKPDTLLKVEGLQTHFFTEGGVVRAVDGVDLIMNRGETLAVVGESGCGKTITALSIVGLVPSPPGKILGGSINFNGRELRGLANDEMKKIRGNDIAMIFQEPMTALNPVFTVGWQISEAIRLHSKVSKAEAKRRTVEMLKVVGIPSPELRVKDFPHQMSGGMRQRVMIAMALSCRPDLLIADEPTTALDVTIQAQVLELINQLKKEFGASVMLITHDLGVVAETADNVLVMYAGKAVEYADVSTFVQNPLHPYSQGLIESIPRLDGGEDEDLYYIKGMVPDLRFLPPGCSFAPRCPKATRQCEQIPPLKDIGDGHLIRCWLYN
jgi:oligopeptide transport system ATP-binding protein